MRLVSSLCLVLSLSGCLPEWIDTKAGTKGFDFDGDGFVFEDDCDDEDDSVFPGAPELCDGLLTNCDFAPLAPDEADADGDGHVICAEWQGEPSVKYSGDCDDADNSTFLGSAEEQVGTGIDRNCDGLVVCFEDSDGDKFRTDETVASDDTDCIDSGEALVTAQLDCNDSDSNVFPGSVLEEPGSGIDTNCDGAVDCYVDQDDDGYRTDVTAPSADADCDDAQEALSAEGMDCDDQDEDEKPGVWWYPDFDGDQEGDAAAEPVPCEREQSTDVTDSSDCADEDEFRNHLASEVCNGVDDDCDNKIDDADDDIDRTAAEDYYLDEDGDGFGAGDAVTICGPPGSNYVLAVGDCLDSDILVYDGAEIYVDCDDDGYLDAVAVDACQYIADNDGCVEGLPGKHKEKAPSSAKTDCDDEDETRFPNMTWYTDCDADKSYEVREEQSCELPICADGERLRRWSGGYV